MESEELKTAIWAHYIAEDYQKSNHILLTDEFVEGEISIDLVVEYDEVNDTGFEQTITNSSHIIAYIKIVNVLDEFSALCNIDGFPDLVRVEFEKIVELKKGQSLKVVGSLELELL